jgi:hypothetical protein
LLSILRGSDCLAMVGTEGAPKTPNCEEFRVREREVARAVVGTI